MMDMAFGETERNWYKESKHLAFECPYCSFEGVLPTFISDGTMPVTYYGFCFGNCPECKDIVIFDFERKELTKVDEGRKPFPVLVGVGRIINIIIAAVGLYFLANCQLFWLPITYILTIAIEVSWELILKRENPDWYWSDPVFHSVTDRIAYVGMPMTIIRVIIIIAAGYQLWKT